jgi:hypothetical protein
VLDHLAGDRLRRPPWTFKVEGRPGMVGLGERVHRWSQARTLAKPTGAVDGLVAVESRLDWRIEDTTSQTLLAEPMPLR